MGHEEPSFLFSMVSAFSMPILLFIGLFFFLKSFDMSLKLALSETNSILREILAELKKSSKSDVAKE